MSRGQPDVTQAFPEIRRALRRLRRGKLAPVSTMLAEHSKAPWHERSFCVDMFGDEAPLHVLDDWCRHEPTCPDAWLLRGRRRTHWAWDARGSGRANEVEEDAWQVFYGRLHRAEADLMWASELLPEDPEPYGSLISVAMGLSQGTEKVLEHLLEALKRDPEHYDAYSAAMYALSEKWLGSHDQMFQVARQAARHAHPANDLAGVLIGAHVERWAYYRLFDEDQKAAQAYARRLEARREVSELFDRTVAVDGYQGRRLSFHVWNQAAFWFYLSSDRKRLAHCLRRIGRAFGNSPWYYAGNARKVIAAARKKATG